MKIHIHRKKFLDYSFIPIIVISMLIPSFGLDKITLTIAFIVDCIIVVVYAYFRFKQTAKEVKS
jgi:hypothetical protein